MAIDLSTAGILVYYGAESTSGGGKPTALADYTQIHGIKSIPDFNVAPETYQSTTLEATQYHTYVEGLRDIGGALAFGANLTEQLMDDWDDLMTAYATAAAAEKKTYFVIVIPGLSNSLYFYGKPSDLGMPAAEVGQVLETQVYITPMGEPEWDAKPTPPSPGP